MRGEATFNYRGEFRNGGTTFRAETRRHERRNDFTTGGVALRVEELPCQETGKFSCIEGHGSSGDLRSGVVSARL